MRFLLDTNVLVYALREEAPQNPAAQRWLKDALAAPEIVAATSTVLAGLVRITSQPRFFTAPSAMAALSFVDELLDAGLHVYEPTPRHWPVFRDLCLRHGLTGNDVPDAHLAAIAIEQDATLVTHDHGFDRFSELRRLDPLAV